MIATVFRRHPLLGAHVVIVALLLIGLIQRTGATYLGQMALYLGVLLGAYAVVDRSTGKLVISGPTSRAVRPLAILVLIATTTIALAHWIILGHVPLIAALQQQDDLAVQAIRLHMTTDIPTWLNYASNFIIKAFLPFTLIMCYRRHRTLFVATAVIGTLYAVSLVQKSYVITLFVPLWAAFLVTRKWRAFGLLTAGFVIITSFLFVVAKPQKLVQAAQDGSVTATAPLMDEGVKERGLVGDLLWSVTRRVVLMPGWTVAAWFQHVPIDVPFQHGAAVRPLAKAMGEEYVALDRVIYDLEYPEYAAKGTQGTMGSASFMYGWANFGWWGLLWSGIITAVVLRTFTLVFGARWQWALCLSIFPLLVHSSAALPTVLLTHGWGITLLLFAFFAPPHDPLQ